MITNHRIPDSNADFCDDSLAIIPDFVNGNSIGWFAVRRFGQNRHSYSSGDSLEVVYVPIRKLILGAGISSKNARDNPGSWKPFCFERPIALSYGMRILTIVHNR